MTRLTALALAAAALLIACSEPRTRPGGSDDDDDDDSTTSTGEGGFGGTSNAGGASPQGGAGGAGGAGGDNSATYPCTPTAPACTKVTSDCIALADNSSATSYGLRIGQLEFVTPKAFSAGLIDSTIKSSTTMNLGQCYLNGTGTFSWLLYFSPSVGQLLTGGSKPIADPTAGYCFVNEALSPYSVAPVQTAATVQMNGAFSASIKGPLIIPMYLTESASSYILLPLHELTIAGTLSPDRNCIGQYNDETLKSQYKCQPESGTFAFSNGGTINGYISLEEADEVSISSLGQSLCVLLSGNAATYGDGSSPSKCKRDAMGTILFKGDWCSETNDASCSDAVKIEAGFAASSVAIGGVCP